MYSCFLNWRPKQLCKKSHKTEVWSIIYNFMNLKVYCVKPGNCQLEGNLHSVNSMLLETMSKFQSRLNEYKEHFSAQKKFMIIFYFCLDLNFLYAIILECMTSHGCQYCHYNALRDDLRYLKGFPHVQLLFSMQVASFWRTRWKQV